MPKPNQTITPREREICERVRIIRTEIAKWSQPMLATALGLTQNQLASIEYGRAPLRWWIGLQLCQRFDINQRWLALNELPRQPYFIVDTEWFKGSFGNTALFSWVFDRFVDRATRDIVEFIKQGAGQEKYELGDWINSLLENFPPAGSPPSPALAFLMQKLIPLRMASLPDELLGKYGAALLKTDRDFLKEHQKESSPRRHKTDLERLKEVFGEKSLTDISPKRKKESMAEIQRLIKDAKAKLSKPGAKSALARELEVAPARISEWLSGEKEPSGEYALQLYNWVYDLKPKQ